VLVEETRHVLYIISFSIISHSLNLNRVSFGRNSAVVKDILQLPNVSHAHILEINDMKLNRYGDGSKPYPPGEHQNSWDLWMFIPLKMVCIGIDP